MMLRLALALSIVAVAACGDNKNSATVDGPPDVPTIDAPPPTIDATACDPTGYPEMVRIQSVDLIAPTTLTLDGTGTRCEQIVRALLAPTGAPPELAELDTEGVTSTCEHDDVLDREIVRLRAPLYGGEPVYAPVQDALVHVDSTDTVVFLHGDFLPAGHLPGPGCFSPAGIAALVPGAPMSYLVFAACSPQNEDTYTVAADDEIEVVGQGTYLDADGNLRRVFAIDVYLLPAHVTPEIGNSDAFCCDGSNGTNHCVGFRLFLDAFTGDVIGQEPHCHTC